MIKAMEQVNCTTTSTFLGMDAHLPTWMLPFSTSTGLNEDR